MIMELNLTVLLSFLCSALRFFAFLKKLVKEKTGQSPYSKSGSCRMGFSASDAKKDTLRSDNAMATRT